MIKTAIVAISLAFCLVLTGCGAEKIFSVALPLDDYTTLNPIVCQDGDTAEILNQLFEGLTTVTKDNKVELLEAASVDVSADKRTYIFTLRDDIKWTDGTPVTAFDYEYSFMQMLNPARASELAKSLYIVKNAIDYNEGRAAVDTVGIKAVDDLHLKIELQEPSPYLLNVLTALFPVNKKTELANLKWADKVETLIGNGPYKATQVVHGKKVRVEKRDDYFNFKDVVIPKADFLFINSETARSAMYEKNDVSIAKTPQVDDIKKLRDRKELVSIPAMATTYYVFNCSRAPFTDYRVRRALSLAIDRDLLVNKVIANIYGKANGFVPSGVFNPQTGVEFRTVAGDYFVKPQIAEAKKLLSDAGFPEGKNFPKVTLKFNTSDIHKRVAEAIQEMWKQNLGVKVDLLSEEWKVYLKTVDNADFDIAKANFGADYPDPAVFLYRFGLTADKNSARWTNIRYGELVSKAFFDNNIPERFEECKQAERLLIDDAPVAPLFDISMNYAVKRSVETAFLGTSISLKSARVNN